MAIRSFNCSCGNKDPKKALEYDGSLGYEAIICTVCGAYYDVNGEYPADDWSREYIKRNYKGNKSDFPENTEVFL